MGRVDNERPAGHSLSINGACNGEDRIVRSQSIYIDAMVTFCRVERYLVVIQRFNEGDDFRLIRGFEGNGG